MKKSVMAGVFIGIGCTVYTLLENKIAGSLLFSLGLCAILTTELDLFTGKVGYYLNDINRWYELFLIWLGNFYGISIVAIIAKYSRLHVITNASARATDDFFSLAMLGFACGLLMYTATRFWSIRKSYLGVILCVSVFILCGFEHCIADMYYLLLDPNVTLLRAVKVLIAVTLGNTIGGFVGNKTL